MTHRVKSSDILSRAEITQVIQSLTRRKPISLGRLQNLTIFRLTIGAGLRCSEVCGIDWRDVHVSGDRPHIAIRAEVGKGGKAREVPLWWDIGTLDTLIEWQKARQNMGAGPDDPVCCIIANKRCLTNQIITPGADARIATKGKRLIRQAVSVKWKIAVKCLGPERVRELSPHSGRHTFCSYMVAERGTVAVRDAAGHSSIAVTNAYLHVLPEDLERRGDVFGGTNSSTSFTSTSP